MGLKRHPIRLLGLGLLAAAGGLLSGCGRSLPQSPFDAAGKVSQMQGDLLTLSLWFAIGIGVFVTAALLFVMFRFREKGNEQQTPAQVHGNTKLEITWTLIPIIILVIVAVPTVRTAFATKDTNDPNALEVKVIGHQWWWEFQYPQLGITTANELYIPSHRDVRIQMTSADVMHSFWVPKLAGKMDVIPGRINTMWFEADREETYFGQCAQFCSTSHANMHFRVVAVSSDQFDGWVKARQAGAPTPTDPVAVAGMELFMGKEPSKANCIACHTIDGTKAQGKVGPNLSNIGGRSIIAAGTLDNTEENLKKWITNPQSVKPGAKMVPHPNLSDQELHEIITYLESLK